MNASTRKMVLSGMFLALGLVLPFLTGQLPGLGSALLPMHIPVILCGFICGRKYGAGVGFIVPILRSFLFSMPPMFPVAIAMAFELAVYGFTTGLLYEKLPKSKFSTVVALVVAMMAGRIVWGIVSLILFGIMGNAFSIGMFIGGAFLNAIPGIVVQLILIPAILYAYERSGGVKNA